ncbi:MAG TPA: ABC transporter permease subunit [Candidatus Paceibacterota bacterium]
MLEILAQYHRAFLGGLGVTLELLFLVAVIGIPFGILLGVIGARFIAEVGLLIRAISFFIASVPFIVLLFWLHYPLQSVLGIVVDPFWTTVLALGLVNLFLTAELVHRELAQFPKSYREAAYTLGLSTAMTARFIELPILAKRITPQLLTNQGQILQYTLLASFISVPELFRVAQNVNAMTYRPVEVYSLLVIFFALILGPLHLGVRYLKRDYAI